jgi:BlaI family penicillinase repressor
VRVIVTGNGRSTSTVVAPGPTLDYSGSSGLGGVPMRVVLADREAEVMGSLWEHGPSTVAEVQGYLSDALAYTTVLTVLRKLESKGYVRHTEEGRTHRYRAVVSRNAAQLNALRDLAAKFFKGSTELLLTHAVSQQKMSDDELRRLRQLIDGLMVTKGASRSNKP